MHYFIKFTLPVIAVASSAGLVFDPPASASESAATKVAWENRDQGTCRHQRFPHNDGNVEVDNDVNVHELESLRMSLLQGSLRVSRGVNSDAGLFLEVKPSSTVGDKDQQQSQLVAGESARNVETHLVKSTSDNAEKSHGDGDTGSSQGVASSNNKHHRAVADLVRTSFSNSGETARDATQATSLPTTPTHSATSAESSQEEQKSTTGSTKVSATSDISRLLVFISDPNRGLVENAPVMLVYMMASMIVVMLIIHVSSWSMEDVKDVDDFRPTASMASSGMLPYRSFPEQPLRPSSYPVARSSLQSASPVSLGAPTTRSLFTSESVPAYSRRVSDAEDSMDAICPALILPQGEALFSILADSMRRLGLGQYPVEVLGPSGRQLLHARLPAQPAGGMLSTNPGPGRWLELTSTAKSRHPHACVGPLPLAAAARMPLEIRGPRGDVYGSLEHTGSGWSARRKARVILTIEPCEGGVFRAVAPDRGVVATASPNVEHALIIQVNSGVDALLALLCLLASVLMTPDLSGFRV